MAKSIQNKTKTSPPTASRKEQLRAFLQSDTPRFYVGIILLVISLFLLLAFISHFFTGAVDQGVLESVQPSIAQENTIKNYAGRLGAQMAYFFINQNFGIASFFIPLFLILASMKLMRAYHVSLLKWFFNFSFLLIWLSLSLATFIPDSQLRSFSFHLGGNHGCYMSRYLSMQIGWLGLVIVLVVAAICYLVYISRQTIEVVRIILNPQDYIKAQISKRSLGQHVPPLSEEDADSDAPSSVSTTSAAQPADTQTVQLNFDTQHTPIESSPQLILADEEEAPITLQPPPASAPLSPPQVDLTLTPREEEDKASSRVLGDDFTPYDPKLDLEHYKYPTLELLKKYQDDAPAIDMAEQNENKERIITILRNFDVEISSIKATIGPTITLYEITPAQGVRISKIRNLEDDIALSLRALGIRIIAPIPGKGTIGIEVPNKSPKIVSMESILNSRKFQECEYELPIALGKTITNEVFMVDLAKMPHLLVAGATGQGKSVGLNAIITSLVYKKHPAELKFVMVDPKKVEFSIYSPIEHHFLAKIPDEGGDAIITDVTKVIQTLKSLCQEMDTRYDLLKKAKVRNIKEYNVKFKARHLSPESGHRFLPYIVVIIDEFGDLIMTAGKEVELPIARIAQLARAVGMHMVIATQRPTTNIITGTIKANFPARMAFKVMSQIDSRTILDRPGANQLIGKGDMLFLVGGDPVRVQCAFVDTPEVERINSHIARQQSYVSAYELPEVLAEGDSTGAQGEAIDVNNLDPLFEEAARLIVIHQQGSTSLIQRKFSIGYNRAGRLMDQLEKMGVVGPAQGSKPRDVLCNDENDLQARLSAI